MSNRKYIFFAWVFLPLLLLPTLSLAGTTTGSATSVRATDPDLAAAARKVPLRGPFRLTGLELDGIPGASDLELERFRVFTPDARIVLDGSKILPIPDNRYFKGRIAGEPGSRVLLTLRQSGELRGLVLRDGELWMLAGGSGTGIVAPGLVSRRADPELEPANRTKGFRCDNDRLPLQKSSSEPAVSEPQSLAIQQGVGPTYAARVAIETDTEYFAHFGGAPAAYDYAADLIAYSSTIYEAEVNTSLQISSIQLRSSSDPWDETSCTDMLYEVQNHWQIEPSLASEERTLVHMLSGKNTQCGVAWVGYLCDKEYGFGVSSGLTFEFDIENPGIAWDIMVVSHEIGHTFNSPHTNCYAGLGNNQAQVDQCTNVDCGWNPISYDCYCGAPSLPCSGQDGCGTLMSYCHLLSGGMDNIAWSLGTGHPYGDAPYRVPMRMYKHVESRAISNPGCFNPLLTITKQGTASGTVTSLDGGIDCGSDCAEIYSDDDVVSLTHDPGANAVFAGWSGHADCSDGSVTMSSSKTCTATFNLAERSLTIVKSGSGGMVTSSPSGIDCGGDCQEDYPHGTPVGLAAVPDLGSMVGGWSGDADCSDGELTMDSDLACTMTFEACAPSQVDESEQDVSIEQEFAACNILTAGNFVVLAPGGNVTFRAGNSIVLKDGFVVESGAAFRAIIGPPPS